MTPPDPRPAESSESPASLPALLALIGQTQRELHGHAPGLPAVRPDSHLERDAKGNLYLTEVGKRAVGIIPAETRRYRRYVQDPAMVWPDGVVYVSDGWMYSGAAQLPLVGPLQKYGVARNKPPYLIYRFRPEVPGRPGS